MFKNAKVTNVLAWVLGLIIILIATMTAIVLNDASDLQLQKLSEELSSSVGVFRV